MRGLLFIFLFFSSGQAFAADAACEDLKMAASCPEAKAHALTELSSQLRKCQTRLETAKCDKFWLEHPSFKAHANVCAPADLCLFRTVEGFEDGCNALGISFTRKYKQGCSDGVMKDSCMAWHVLQETFLDLLPYLKGPLLGGKSLITPIVHGVEELPEAYSFARHLSCVDTLTRNKIACYIAVHGGMVVLSAGARAASEYAALAKEVEELETTAIPAANASAPVSPPPEDTVNPDAVARLHARDSVQNVRLTDQALDHTGSHFGLSFAQKNYVDEVLEARAEGKIKTQADAEYWLDSPSPGRLRSGTVNASKVPRPFRNGKKTSIFPPGITQQDVVEQMKKGAFSIIEREDPEAVFYRVQIKGNNYRVVVCRVAECLKSKAVKNDVVTVFPECGPEVKSLVPLKTAKTLLTSGEPLTAQSFYIPDPCP